MKHRFFVGLPHQKIHSLFFHRLLGGEYVEHPCAVNEKNFPDLIFRHDSPDTVWFFNDVYFNLHPRLKGRQVFVGHGLGLGWAMSARRADCLSKYFSLIFETGQSPNNKSLEHLGVEPSKIHKTGYTLLFELPNLPTEPGRVLFSSTCYTNWNSQSNLWRILETLDPALHGAVTVHPELPQSAHRRVQDICRGRKNLTFVASQEELLKEFARCQCVVGQLSSVVVPFYYQKKPVLFLRGRISRNPFKGMGWSRIKKQVGDPLLDRVFEESTKISSWRQFDANLVDKAKVSASAQNIFFGINYDKKASSAVILESLRKLEAASA